MSGLPLGLVIEGAVAVLLAMTIGYCMLLNRRLKRLQADREVLQQMISDLVQATTLANGAITGLKQTAVDADQKLATRMAEAEEFAIELANHVNAGQAVMDRIVRITEAVKHSGGGIVPDSRKAQTALAALERHQRGRESAA